MTQRRQQRLAVFHDDGRTENLALAVQIQRFCFCSPGAPPIPHTAVAAAKQFLRTRCDRCGRLSLVPTAADFKPSAPRMRDGGLRAVHVRQQGVPAGVVLLLRPMPQHTGPPEVAGSPGSGQPLPLGKCQLSLHPIRRRHPIIPANAIAIITPHGRNERVMRSRRKMLPCGHHTAMDEIAWRRDTKTQDGELPDLVCHACMHAAVREFATNPRKEKA